MLKKLISLNLAIVMILSLLPAGITTARAAGDTGYAKFSANYDGGEVLTKSTSNFSSNGSLMLYQVMPEFQREGYALTGYNTKADGSGTTYAIGQRIREIYSMDEDTAPTLYAQWEAVSGNCVVFRAYNALTADGKEYYVVDGLSDSVVLPQGTFFTAAEEGKKVVSWLDVQTWRGYLFGTEFALSSSSTVLYARTAAQLIRFHYKYTETEWTTWTREYSSVWSSISYIPNNVGSQIFLGWNSRSDGTGAWYTSGTLATNAPQELYAIYEEAPDTKYHILRANRGFENGQEFDVLSAGKTLPTTVKNGAVIYWQNNRYYYPAGVAPTEAYGITLSAVTGNGNSYYAVVDGNGGKTLVGSSYYACNLGQGDYTASDGSLVIWKPVGSSLGYFVKDGYALIGFKNTVDGKVYGFGDSLKDSVIATADANRTVNYSAVYTKVSGNYIQYLGNGGTTSAGEAYYIQDGLDLSAEDKGTYADCPFVHPDGKVFAGWMDSSGYRYYPGAAIEATDDLALYAVWSSSLSAPTLTVSMTSAGKPYLTWNEVLGAEKYEVWHSTDGTNFEKLVATSGLKLTHSSAATGTTHYYKVRAITDTIKGMFSSVKIVSVVENLAAPTLTVTTNSAGKPYLSWTAVTGATKYEVYSSTDGKTFTKLIATTGKAVTHSSAKAGTTYYYKACAINATTTGAFSAVKSVSVAASLTAPTLTVTKTSAGKPYLSWTGVTGATKYEVYSSTNGTEFTKLIATTGKTVTHSSAKAGTTYYYKVCAINDTTTGAFSAVKSVSVAASLTAPTLTVSKNTSGKPYLSWTGVTGATKYEVYSSTDGTNFTKLIATTGKVLTHSSAKTGNTYYYKVRAINGTTSGAFSTVKKVTMTLTAPTVTVTTNASGKPYLSWTGVTGATKYEVWYSTDGEDFTKLITTTGKVLTHSSAKVGTTYYYKVRAINATTTGAFSAVKSAVMPLTAPTLTVTKNSSGKPYLTWTGVTGATKYEVYFSADGETFTKLITTTGKVLTHSSAKVGTTYWYKVRAINATTTGIFSVVENISVN